MQSILHWGLPAREIIISSVASVSYMLKDIMKKLLVNQGKELSFFGKTLTMTEEKVCVLGFEPVTEFLPSARFKSGNNMVL